MRQPATTIDLRRDLVGLLPRLRRFANTLAGEVAVADELVQAVCQR
ncbi:RNA polymerase sigma factor, partial [Rhizobium ruizarguesonis]